jgi:hypothetical protein
MPETLIRFSWDVELVDVDNDFDLDVLVSCKRCGGGSLFVNDGTGKFEEDARAIPQYTNNYELAPMDVDGDGFLDIVTVNDGEIVDRKPFHRREHLFLNSGDGRFVDATPELWPNGENLGEDDNMVVFLDADSDGDADFLLGSLTGSDRLHVNDGHGRFRVRTDVLDGAPTPGTLAIAVADLDEDGRLDIVQAQGEHETAVEERIFLGRGLPADRTAPAVSAPSVSGSVVRARIHDFKTPNRPEDFNEVSLEWTSTGSRVHKIPMAWYGEHLYRGRLPESASSYRVCAEDRAKNRACSGPLVSR